MHPNTYLELAAPGALDDLVTDWAQQPADQPWGNRAMLCCDPDGNLINFFTTIDPDSPLRPQH